MKIDKKLIKELVDHLEEFNLTELEYQEGQSKIKVSKASKGIEQIKSSAVVSPNKAVLNKSEESYTCFVSFTFNGVGDVSQFAVIQVPINNISYRKILKQTNILKKLFFEFSFFTMGNCLTLQIDQMI